MKILVVEDEHQIATTIKKGLEQERHAVDTAFDGETGFDFASTNDYDVIVLDLMIPKMSGHGKLAEEGARRKEKISRNSFSLKPLFFGSPEER